MVVVATTIPPVGKQGLISLHSLLKGFEKTVNSLPLGKGVAVTKLMAGDWRHLLIQKISKTVAKWVVPLPISSLNSE